jgi:hypothetical protein
VTIRLAPGEYAEVEAHGIAIGPENATGENWTGLRLGAWIEAREGDKVTFQPAAVTASWTPSADRKTPAGQWKAIVQERIEREGPMPARAADREQLIRRVMPDLIGVPPTQQEIAEFTADNSPDALTALANRLVPRVAPFAGELPAGEIRFRVTAADPDAAKRPRVATGPGWYTIGDHVQLSIVQKRDGNRRVNEANVRFFSPDPKAEPPGKPHEIKLPDGILTWAIAWERGTTVLWVTQKGLVRKYDFANPAEVKESRFEQGGIMNVPEQLRDAVRKALDVPGAPVQQQESLKPKGGAKLKPGTEEKLKWGEPMNGLRAALVIRTSHDEPNAGDNPDLYLLVQNVSDAPIHLNDTTAAPNLRYLTIQRDDVPQSRTRIEVPTMTDVMLQPREATFLLMCPRGATPSRGQLLAAGMLKEPHMILVGQMSIEKAPAGAWTGKLVTGETSGAGALGQPQPKGKEAQSLFKKWLDGARTNGKIPGGALGSLARGAANFVKFNPTDERAPKLAELLKRIDTSHDWTPEEAVALLDDVTAIYAALPGWAEDEPRFSLGGAVQTGQRLPAELENAPWGEAQPNGLRVAWLLDPRAAEHRLGTPLKSRILFHNAGKSTVLFRALTWNQSGVHKARDANGTEINISSVDWTTIPRIVACRLAPGEFMEVIGAGIGVGARGDAEDWQNTRVGSWVEAMDGDEVTFAPAPVSVTGNFTDDRAKGEPGWWLDFINDRLSRDMPLPADAAERGHLLDRAVRDLFGTAPTPEETAAFLADRTPDAFDALAKRLAQRAGTSSFTGTLQSGETKFRVLPVDRDAAKKPRVATGPGRYTLGDNSRLIIVQKPDGERRVNEANIVFFSPDSKTEPPGKPHEIKLPDGHLTWAIAWERGTTVLWVAEKGALRSYDFTKPGRVKETSLEEANLDQVPKPILDALRTALEVPGAPNQAPASPK